MDPLSVIASCAAVAGAGGTVIQGLKKLKHLRKLPNILLAVINEVADLTLVVQEIKLSIQEYQGTSGISTNSISIINQLLDRAQATLLELDQVINYNLLLPPKDNGEIAVSRSAWIREERHVRQVQKRLRTVRLDISTGFAALNFTRTVHLDVRIKELSLMTESIRNSQLSDSSSQQDLSEQLVAQFRHLQELQIHNHEALRSISNDFTTLRESVSSARPNVPNLQHTSLSLQSISSSITPQMDEFPNVVSVKVQQIQMSPCLRGCLCSCHTRAQWKTPQLLDRVIGKLFLGYSSTPSTALSCDSTSCSRYQHNLITVVYVFPQWFLQRTLSMIMLYTQRDGPSMSLRALRTRDPTSLIFFYVSTGDITKVRFMFKRGEASPFDFEAVTSRSLIQVAIVFLQPSMYQYLLNGGADPYLQTGTSLPPLDYVWNRVYGNEGDTKDLAAFQHMLGEDDALDTRRFTSLHRIVLGLDGRDLLTYLQTCSKSELDQGGASGLTGLHWAARRGDVYTTRLLLAAGADPNILTIKGNSALYFAARQGEINIVNDLLTHGAKVDQSDSMRHTPLIFMHSRPGPRPVNLTCLKRLITAGAEIDAQDFQGDTSIMFAASLHFIAALKLLLKNKANINKQNLSGETAIFTTLQYNAHDGLQTLLTHGADLTLYTKNGRSILHVTAEHSDLKTIQILKSAYIRGLQTDRKNKDGKIPLDLAQRRTDETPEWHTAFADLLSSVGERPPEPLSATIPQSTPASAPAMPLCVTNQVYEEARQIYEYLCRIPRPPFAVLRVLIVLCIAIAWAMLRK